MKKAREDNFERARRQLNLRGEEKRGRRRSYQVYECVIICIEQFNPMRKREERREEKKS